MRVMIVSRGYPSKQYPMNGIFEWDQAKALSQAGHQVIFAVVDMRSIRRRRHWGFEKIRQDGVEIRAVNWPVGAVPVKLMLRLMTHALRSLYDRIEQEFGVPDVVHAHFLDQNYAAAMLCREKNIPLVVTEHTSGMNVPVLSKELRQIAKKAYEGADICLAVSSVFCRNLEQATGVPFHVIENIVDTKLFRYIPQIAEERERFTFVAAGNLISRKGYDLLLTSFAEIVPEFPHCALSIFGGGEERQALEQQAAMLSIENQVRFYGSTSREVIATAYGRADAFVLPSRRETFGVVYIEAMAAGLPVIATACGGPEDFVTAQDGYLIAVEDGEGLTEAMRQMILHRDRFDEAAISARVCERFSPEQVAAHLEQIYQQSISKRFRGEIQV